MEKPLHSVTAQKTSILSPSRLISLSVATLMVLGFAWSLSAGLAQIIVEKLPEEIKINVLKKNIERKPPPPAPELKAPPPAFVPPPDIVIQQEAPTASITAQTQVKTPPKISSPASIGKTHFCGDDYYPAISKRLGESGVSTVSFTITAEGSVENPHVVNSSGSERLDNAAMECVRSWHYKPAIQENVPVAVQWTARVVWQLK